MIKVINIISDTNIGGAGKYILSFLDSYDSSKIDMEIFIPCKSLLKKEIEKRAVKFTEVPYIDDASFNMKAVSVLLKLFKEKKPQIVHTHATFSARVAARIYGKCKIIHTRHSVFDPPKSLTIFPLKQINGWINNFFSDEIITVSPAATDNLIKTGTNKRKISVVYNGVKRPTILSIEQQLEIKKGYGLLESDFIVAIIGRLVAVKGHDTVLNAAKLIKDTNVKILIVGTGENEQYLKERVLIENISNVIFLGFVSEVYKIENFMDLQMNASYGTEATSLSLLEGMSLGKPAVVSDFGGNPYVIENNINGLVVKKNNAKALADGIMEMKRNKQLYDKCKENSLTIYEKKYTAEAMSQAIVEIYCKIGGKI